MKIKHLGRLLIGFCLLFSGCNLPSSKPTVATPTIDLVGTIVNQTLEVKPSATIQPTQTIIPPTKTIAEKTLTPTLAQTPTGIPGDPVTTLGKPTGKDTLDNGKGFGVGPEGYEDEGVKITISNSTMVMSSQSTSGWRSWRVRPPKLGNFYIDAKFITDNCNGKDQFGLVLRTPDYESGQGYYYGLTCDGKFYLTRWDANGTLESIPAVASDKILAGPGQTNRLGILAKGNNLTLYMNGYQVQQVTDDTFQDGFFGVFISGFSGNGFVVRLDEISYWAIP
jgi:hypothetical protein